MKEAGGVASLVTRVLSKPREILTTVLLGNELANVAISILAGSLAYDMVTGYSNETVYFASTALTTIVLLIFGEITPKNIAIRTPVIVAQVLVVPFLVFSWVVFPFRWLFSQISDVIVSLFGADPRKGRRLIVEEELRNLLEVGKKEGTLADMERTLIQNALDFSQVKIYKIMTQRENIVSVPLAATYQDILKKIEKKSFSRIIVYRENLNHVEGIFHVKELLPYRLNQKKDFKISEHLRPHIDFSPEDTLDFVFQRFQQNKIHLGLVRDRTQKVIGLVTMDDLLRRFFP